MYIYILKYSISEKDNNEDSVLLKILVNVCIKMYLLRIRDKANMAASVSCHDVGVLNKTIRKIIS